MTKKYLRMEMNHNWLNLKVIMSIICIATCNTANQMGHDTTGLPVASAHPLVATLNHSLEESDTRDSQQSSDTDVKLSTEEREPVLANSQEEPNVLKWIFTRSHSQSSEHNNMKISIKGLLQQNYLIKNRQLMETSKPKQVPAIHLLLQGTRSESDILRNDLPLQHFHRKGQKSLRIKRQATPPADNPSLMPVTMTGGTTTESVTEVSTTSGGTSNGFQVSGETDKVLNRQNLKLNGSDLKSPVSESSQNTEAHGTGALLKSPESPNLTTRMKSSVQVTTVPPVIQGTSQSGSIIAIASGVQVAVESNLSSTEGQEALLPQTSVLLKLTSNLPTTHVPPQTKPHSATTTSSVSKSSSTRRVSMSTNNTLLLIKNNTPSIGSQLEDVHERMSDNEMDQAYRLTNDAYWALGSLTTVLLLLTAGVLYTGLWKKRNHMSNPISDVTCHTSPIRKRKTDLKDFLKKKLRHIKTLNLKDSPLAGSMEMNKHYKDRRNGKSNGVYSHMYDTIPLLERPGDDDEDEFIEWEQSEKDHRV